MKLQALLRQIVVGPALCALFVAAPLSQAGTLIATGFAYGSPESFNLTAPVPIAVSNPVAAGAFAGTFDPGSGPVPIIFWCAELSQSFGFGSSMTYNASLLSNTNLSKLFSEGFAVSNAQTSAAFQLAIWEILFNGGTPFDVTSGPFQATGDATAISMANTLLSNLASTAATAQIFLLSNSDHQDFITDHVPPGTKLTTPEPGSLALLGVGLFVAIFAMRRRTPGISS